MLVQNTLVRTTRRGGHVPVEALCIADRVYDPISDTMDEVVDILARRIAPTKAMSLGVWPVTLAKGSVLPGVPHSSISVSPHQGVVVLRDIPGNGRHREMVVMPAVSLGSARPSEFRAELTYYCIFFDRKRYLEANGLSVAAYTLEDISCA